MEELQLALDMIQTNEYFVKIDLKDVYFSVEIAQEDRKFLKFRWNNQIY